MKQYLTALTIAGFDSSAGAGIQADIKTFSALGVYATCALTGLPVQNTQGVQSVYGIPDTAVAEQLDAVFQDITIGAVKIGMLHTSSIIEIVANKLRFYEAKNIVLDPVMVAKSGDRLLQQEAIKALKECLIPLATTLTPNLYEASVLLGKDILCDEAMEAAAQELLQKYGCGSVLIKGGHLNKPYCADCLMLKDVEAKPYWFRDERTNTRNTHGTGCTLSAAITAFLAQGASILDAVGEAKKYLSAALRAGASYTLGQGHGPAHHFYNYWNQPMPIEAQPT